MIGVDRHLRVPEKDTKCVLALQNVVERLAQRMDLVPSNPLSKALKYAREREEALRLYLSDPELPIDTNHLERTLRVIPIWRSLCTPYSSI